MPINRGDKHWCDPAAETPSGRSNTWTCPDCKKKWKFHPELNLWADAREDVSPRNGDGTEEVSK